MLHKKKNIQSKHGSKNTELDSAVSELTKQTEALLSHFGETAEPTNDENAVYNRPILPKKRSHLKTTGKSFDIIRGPKTKQKIKANLKSVSEQQNKSSSSNVELLLPDHATLSYNESEDSSSSIDGSNNDLSKPKIKLHKRQMNAEDSKIEDQQDGVVSKSAKKVLPPSQTVSRTSLQFSDTQTDPNNTGTTNTTQQPTYEQPTEAIHLKSDEAEPTETETEAYIDNPNKARDTKLEIQESTKDNSTSALSANSEDKKNALYKPINDTDETVSTVFDTEEYHPELHDWSKLENTGSSIWLITLLIVVIVAAALYFTIFKQMLPFNL